jgi:UDP-N-acetylglucosamine:LPS N-acetylglucosamine transferase
LILDASMGAGHSAVAAELSCRLQERGHRTRTADILALLPPGVGSALRGFYRQTISHAPAVYDAIYAAFFRSGPGPRPGSAPLAALAGDRLLREVRDFGPDLVVPVFHLAAQATGRLRATGALDVPSAVVITDFAVHRQWLHQGNDVHLCVSPDAAEQVSQALGRSASAPGPIVPARFRTGAYAPQQNADTPWRSVADGRRNPHPPAVLVSTGSWGIGYGLESTCGMLAGAGYTPVVLCGTDKALRTRVANMPGAIALGWIDDMPTLMSCAAALVDNAAGQTAVQALAARLPVVGYRPIAGHGAEGVVRMAYIGATTFAERPDALIDALGAMTGPGPARERQIAAGLALFADDPARILEDAAQAHLRSAAA